MGDHQEVVVWQNQPELDNLQMIYTVKKILRGWCRETLFKYFINNLWAIKPIQTMFFQTHIKMIPVTIGVL